MQERALTLTELLLIIAIFAIFIAAAVPSFTDADVAAQVTQVRKDLRSVGVALEAYRRDYPRYPMDNMFYSNAYGSPGVRNIPVPNPILKPLTTPVAYIAAIPKDVFPIVDPYWGRDQYDYVATDWITVRMGLFDYQVRSRDTWVLTSNGPDGLSSSGASLIFGESILNQQRAAIDWKVGPGCLYDATNGAVSNGDIVLLHEDMLPAASTPNWQGYR